jgi:hypothetical protein
MPCSSGAGGVGSIPANPDAQDVPSFRRWRVEMKLSPFFYATILDRLLHRPIQIIRVQILGVELWTTEHCNDFFQLLNRL